MRTRIIGIGAAGNKAAICACEDNIISIENILLINSTLKDIPNNYTGNKHCFKDAYGGCGKERKRAKELMLKDLQTDQMKLEEFLGIGVPEQRAELVVIVSSTEGGTGSGSAPILAEYIQSVFNISVRCFGFTGFEEDGRGLMNTVEYFQEMKDTFAVETVQNTKYLKACNNNKIKAEKEANADFCKKVSILFGNPLRDSDHNIDPTDLLKVSTTPGYSVIEFKEFSKIKNRDAFRELVESMIDNSNALDLNEPSQKKMAVIININKESTDVIDYRDILVKRFGICFEIFEHIQHETDMPEFFAFISVGSKIPVKEIEAIYDKYKQYTSQVDKTKDSFFSKKFEFDDKDSMFDLEDIDTKQSAANKNDFFNKIKNNSSDNKTVKIIPETEDVEDAY